MDRGMSEDTWGVTHYSCTVYSATCYTTNLKKLINLPNFKKLK